MRRLFICLLGGALGVCVTAGCSDSASGGSRVELSVTKSFYGKDKIKLTGPAFLDVSGSKAPYDYDLRVFNVGAGATCDTKFSFSKNVGGDGFAFRVQNDSMKPGKVKFDMKPADLDGVSYTIYWPKNGKTTNSGNGAGASSVKVKLTSIAGDTATGEISGKLNERGTETVSGTFTAKICHKPG